MTLMNRMLNLDGEQGSLTNNQKVFVLQGDFGGTGNRDLLLIQKMEEAYQAWLIHGNGSETAPANLKATEGWHPSMACDVNQDGRHELLWKHVDGTLAVTRVDHLINHEAGGSIQITPLFCPPHQSPLSIALAD